VRVSAMPKYDFHCIFISALHTIIQKIILKNVFLPDFRDDVQRSWTEVETYELIEHVSHYRCLYESQNSQYKNVLVKTQAKAKIASNFDNCGNAIDMIRLIVNLFKNFFFYIKIPIRLLQSGCC
jgi:Alcohol dehydrogenase transcription factor Myb/SANT-like